MQQRERMRTAATISFERCSCKADSECRWHQFKNERLCRAIGGRRQSNANAGDETGIMIAPISIQRLHFEEQVLEISGNNHFANFISVLVLACNWQLCQFLLRPV